MNDSRFATGLRARISSVIGDQRGITGLEAAIVLIAFVVVASVFAFTVLSAGLFSAERGKETVHAGLKEAQGSMEMRGSVIATNDAGDLDGDAVTAEIGTVDYVVSNAVSGQPVDLTPPGDNNNDGIPNTTSTHKLIVSYTDQNQNIPDVTWTAVALGDDDGDNLLELGEKFQITVQVARAINTSGTTNLTGDTRFTIEAKPPTGAVMIIERTTPSGIDPIMDLR